MALAFPSVRRFALARRPALSAHYAPVALLILVLGWLTIAPIARMILASFTSTQSSMSGATATLDNYARVYAEPATYQLLLNSFLFSLGSCLLSLALGTSLAWLVERTNTPLRRVFSVVAVVPIIVPGIVMTIAWIFLLSPQIGIVNAVARGAFGLSSPVVDIYSLGGMIWVEGLVGSPLVFLLMSAALTSMDASLEESASMSGAGTLQTLRRVTAPLMLPALASAMLIVFIRGLEAFEVPALVGVPGRIFVFTSKIYLAMAKSPADYGLATTLATSLMAISIVGILLYRRLTAHADRFATVTGKAFRPRRIDLGPWRYASLAFMVLYTLAIVVLPLAVLAWISLIPFFAVPSSQMMARVSLENYRQMLVYPNAAASFQNGLMLSIGTAVGAVLLSAVIGWISLRSRLPGRQLLDGLAFLPIAVPGTVMGAALLSLYLGLPVPVYGTLLVLFLAYMTRFLPYGMRAANGALLQVGRELEEAAEMSGAAWPTRFRAIMLPLLRPGLLAGGTYIFIVSFRELSSSALLTGPQSTVMAVLILELQESGRYPQVAALSLLMVAVMALLVAVFRRLGGRVGIEG